MPITCAHVSSTIYAAIVGALSQRLVRVLAFSFPSPGRSNELSREDDKAQKRTITWKRMGVVVFCPTRLPAAAASGSLCLRRRAIRAPNVRGSRRMVTEAKVRSIFMPALSSTMTGLFEE